MEKEASANASFFLLYRKVPKSSEMVYNEIETKNDITKERRCDFATTLFMVFFVLVGRLHYLTMEKKNARMELSISHDLSILIK